jgi:hypothetical protein
MADKFNVPFKDKGAIDDLVKLYTDTANNIVKSLDGMTAGTLAQRKQVLVQIEKELAALGVDTGKWVETNIPLQYRMGMQNAITQLKTLDFLPLDTEALFTTINRQAVAAMIDDTSRSFADALTTVGRSVKNIQSDMFQQEIKARLAEGTITGETRKSIQADIKQKIQDQGITALKDKAGRDWSLDRYAEMLARTKLAEARNTGLTNKMLENSNDLVQVSSNGSSHPACADWEGQILSITGQTPDYPTVDEAEADGLFHPNCQHTINAIEPDLAERTYGYDPDTGEYAQGILSSDE